MLGIKSKFVLVMSVLAGLIIQGCASDPVIYTINQTITSDPAGADVYFGTDRTNLSNLLGKTPYSDNTSSYSTPSWRAGYYKIVKRGYKPFIEQVPQTFTNLRIAAVLEPLPKLPDPPVFTYPTAEDVAIKDLDISANRNVNFQISKDNKIAVMAFQEPAGSGAGKLVADNLILELQRGGYKVIDREQIDRIMREQGMVADGKTRLTDLEISNKLGKLLQADFIIYGAITEYVSMSENIQLSPIVDPSDKNRYQRQYDDYVGFYTQFGDDFAVLPTMPKTLREWEFDAAGNARSAYLNIARVGVTAKMVDIKTSDIAWVGFASTQDLRIQSAMEKIVKGMTYSFLAPQ